jgi:broad specificity phosphatase PhoE
VTEPSKNASLEPIGIRSDAPTYPVLNLVRHSRVADYACDVSITAQGIEEARNRGRELAAKLPDGETIFVHAGPARRARQTANALLEGLREILHARSNIHPTVNIDDRLENCQCLIAGNRFDVNYAMLDAAKELSRHPAAPADTRDTVRFLTRIWHETDDAMDAWMNHDGPGAESPATVNARTQDFLNAMLGDPRAGRIRHIAVTHSGNLRAYLKLAFAQDIGGKQMPYVDILTVNHDEVDYHGTRSARPQT